MAALPLPPRSLVKKESLEQLAAMGFSSSAAEEALRLYPDVESAANYLILDTVGPRITDDWNPGGPTVTTNTIPPVTSAFFTPNSTAVVPYKAPTAAPVVDLTAQDDLARALEESKRLAEQSSNQDLDRAIQASLTTKTSVQPNSKYDDEPLDPFRRTRENLTPVGLKNVGNTCYVNSLLQAYFQLRPFRHAVLSFSVQPPSWSDLYRDTVDLTTTTTTANLGSSGSAASDLDFNKSSMIETLKRKADADAADRKANSLKFLHHLQGLFGFLLASRRKYYDPTPLLESLRDERGNKVTIGNQEDVSEFNHIFLENLETALKDTDTVVTSPPTESENAMNIVKPAALRKSDSAMDTSADQPSPQPQSPPSAVEKLRRMFFGKMRSELSAFEQDGTPVNLINEEEFAEVILGVENFKSFYASLDAFTSAGVLENFKTPMQHETTAKKQYWFGALPDVLLFQLQRVNFSKVVSAPVKVHSEFAFERRIYMDRYLLDNRELINQLRYQNEQLEHRRRQLMSKLAAYETFNGEPVPLNNLLRGTVKFLYNYSLQEHPYPSPVTEPNKLFDCASLLEQFAVQVEADVKDLKLQLDSVVQEQNVLFDVPQLQQRPFSLHAVLVHDGEAGLGHYYAFIKDHATNTWKKYNDIHVSDVTEEEVKNYSFGGHGSASAYCLVYIDDQRVTETMTSNTDLDVDLNLVPTSLQKFIQDDNHAHETELRTWKNSLQSKTQTENLQAFSELPIADIPHPNSPVLPTIKEHHSEQHQPVLLHDSEWISIVEGEMDVYADNRLEPFERFYSAVHHANSLHAMSPTGTHALPDGKTLPSWLQTTCALDYYKLREGHKLLTEYASFMIIALKNIETKALYSIVLDLLPAIAAINKLKSYGAVLSVKALHVSLAKHLIWAALESESKLYIQRLQENIAQVGHFKTYLNLAVELASSIMRAVRVAAIDDQQLGRLRELWIEEVERMQNNTSVDDEERGLCQRLVNLLIEEEKPTVYEPTVPIITYNHQLAALYKETMSKATASPLLQQSRGGGDVVVELTSNAMEL